MPAPAREGGRAGRPAACRACASTATGISSRRRLSSEPHGFSPRHHNRGRMNRQLIVGLAVAAAVIAAGGYAFVRGKGGGDVAALGSGAAPASAAAATAGASGPPVSVTTVAVQKRDVDVMLEATGTVTALNSV